MGLSKSLGHLREPNAHSHAVALPTLTRHQTASPKPAAHPHHSLQFKVLAKIQQFMHNKEYRLIDLFRDKHINNVETKDWGRSAWLLNGGHEEGAMLLGHHQLMDFFNNTVKIRVSGKDVQHLIDHIAIRGDLHHRDGFINVHELDHAVHKQHMQIAHEMALMSSGLNRFAERIRDGEATLKPDAHSRYREQNHKQLQDPTAAGHQLRQKLAKGPRSVGGSVFKPQHDLLVRLESLPRSDAKEKRRQDYIEECKRVERIGERARQRKQVQLNRFNPNPNHQRPRTVHTTVHPTTFLQQYHLQNIGAGRHT